MNKSCNLHKEYYTGCLDCQHDCIEENEELKYDLEKAEAREQDYQTDYAILHAQSVSTINALTAERDREKELAQAFEHEAFKMARWILEHKDIAAERDRYKRVSNRLMGFIHGEGYNLDAIMERLGEGEE